MPCPAVLRVSLLSHITEFILLVQHIGSPIVFLWVMEWKIMKQHQPYTICKIYVGANEDSFISLLFHLDQIQSAWLPGPLHGKGSPSIHALSSQTRHVRIQTKKNHILSQTGRWTYWHTS